MTSEEIELVWPHNGLVLLYVFAARERAKVDRVGKVCYIRYVMRP